MQEYGHSLRVKIGNSHLPFFAEYPYFLWGEVNYDSEGNCKRPTDRHWTSLYLAHRNEDEQLEIFKVSKWGKPQVYYEIAGTNLRSVRLPAYLTAFRTDGRIIEPDSSGEISLSELEKAIDNFDKRFEDVEQVRTMFLNPVLSPFDSHSWWGGWKWCGERASDFTMGLRLTMKAVTEQHADEEFIDWLYEWWDKPPQSFHRDGVRYAIKVLTGRDPLERG